MAYGLRLPFVYELEDKVEPSPTHPAMLFGLAVIRCIPGAKLAHRDHKSLWVYLPDSHFALGAVGHSAEGRGAATYNVFSNNIINQRHSSGGYLHHMQSANTMERAVKNACKALRPTRPEECLEYTWSEARLRIQDASAQARSMQMKLERSMFSTSIPPATRVVRELYHLLDVGHTFLNPDTGDLLTQHRKLAEELAQEEADKPMVFVAARMQGMIPVFETFQTPNANNHNPRWGDLEVYYDELPSDIAGRVAVLNMVAQDTYVAGVGYKVTPRLFYVAQ